MSDWTACDCGRGSYDPDQYGSCYTCFTERRADYAQCIYCDAWHSPEFDTCFNCRPQGRDEATAALKRVILTRDGHKCRYCGITEGEPQEDPRLIRPACPPRCITPHNHRWPCKLGCDKSHQHRKPGDDRCCKPGCAIIHMHLAVDDDGVRPARLHVDHIRPCAHDGTADPWNLQTLCGVCNIAKGADWLQGSRHWRARRVMIAAYMTYLSEWLDDDEMADLLVDAEFDAGITTRAEAWEVITADYAQQVRASRLQRARDKLTSA